MKTGYDNLLKYYTSGNYTGTQAFDLGTSLADSYYKEVTIIFDFFEKMTNLKAQQTFRGRMIVSSRTVYKKVHTLYAHNIISTSIQRP